MTTKIITGVIISLVLVTTTLLSLSILHRPTELLEKEEQQDMGEKVAEIANLGERENPLYIFLCRLEERDK
jgi:hypothetical protein